MPSKRRPVGDSLIGATINFVGATPRKREEGRAVSVYSQKIEAFSAVLQFQERAGQAQPLQKRENQRRPPRKAAATKPGSATDEVAEEFFDAGLFARVILLGNGAGLLAQLQTKHFFLQRVEIGVYRFLDGFDAGLLLCSFGGGFFRLCERSALALLSGHQDNLFARQQNRAQGENRNKAKEQRPFVIINARRSEIHLRDLRAGVPFLGLLALSTGGMGGLWRTNARHRNVQSAFGGQGLVQKHVHSLLLSGGTDAVSGQRYAGRRYQKHAYARVNGGKPQVRGIAGIRKLVRKANIRFSGMKRVSDGVEAFALVNRGLRHIHAKGAGGRDILKRGLVGDREFEIALAAEIRLGRIGIVLDVVLFGADQLAVARLKDDDVRRGENDFRILGYVEDLDIHLGAARRQESIEADTLIGDADEDGPRADGVVGGGELALGVAFDRGEKRHALHGAEEIHVRIGNRLAGSAIDDRAVNGSGERYGGGEK